MLSGENANGSFLLKVCNIIATVAESVVSRDNAMNETDLFVPLPIETAAP